MGFLPFICRERTLAPGVSSFQESHPSAGYIQDYVYGLEYRTNSGGGTLTLEAIYHAEGRITPLGGSNYQYEYTISDHLGNARLCFADLNANGIVDVPGDVVLSFIMDTKREILKLIKI